MSDTHLTRVKWMDFDTRLVCLEVFNTLGRKSEMLCKMDTRIWCVYTHTSSSDTIL